MGLAHNLKVVGSNPSPQPSFASPGMPQSWRGIRSVAIGATVALICMVAMISVTHWNF